MTDTTDRTLSEHERRRLGELRHNAHRMQLAVLRLEQSQAALTARIAALEKKPKPAKPKAKP